MKIAHVIPTISLLLCTVSPLTAEEQVMTAPDKTPDIAELQQAQQEYIRIRKDCLSALRRACNKETADAAAEISRRHEEQMEKLGDRLQQMDPDSISSALNNARLGRASFKKEMNRLLLSDFYGSASLSDVVMDTPIHAMPAQELPQNIRQELEKRAQEALLFREKLGELIHGGPGFTQQTAWILTSAPDIQLMDTCSMLMGYLYPNTNMLEAAGLESSAVYHEKLFTDGKALIRFCVDIIPTGNTPAARYRFTQWFDVSAIVPYRSKSDVNQAVLSILDTIQQLAKLAEGVHDKDSADTAAEKITALRNNERPLLEGIRWLDEDEFMDLAQDNNIDVNTLITPLLKLNKANYHGSEKLRDALRLSK